MQKDYTQKLNADFGEKNERLRKDVMRTLEPYGSRGVSDLAGMSESERLKWLFWNIHENLDDIRRLEPKLIAQVVDTEFRVTDGRSMWTEEVGVEKKLALNCKWHLLLVYAAFQNEETYPVGDGLMDLFITDTAPLQPALQQNQKGFLDSDNSLYPNQLFLYGWMSEGVWAEIKTHLFSTTPHCQTELFLQDNCLFPVKAGFDFVAGPPGSIGLTNMEFRISSHTSDRRMNRRNEPVQR